jgi:uncharacterized protein YydD (DUF2326 family)
LEQLYQEVGVVLPTTAIRRFAEVRRFHESVVANRRSYLSQEIDDARHRIALRDRQKQTNDERRAKVMEILRSHGALDHFTLLQGELNRMEAEAAALQQRLMTAENLESGKTELEMDRARLVTRLRQDYAEQSERVKASVLTFGEISNALYESPGIFTISPESNGPRFDVKIHAAKSKGINNMQIFCFDMMLTKLCAQRRIGPGFLIHDSHLFDGVDERQVAKALEIGADTTAEIGWQYIVTLNSDALPPSFNANGSILPTRLTDATEDGGLFGIRFG